MDALSSQASLAGYKAVLMAANRLGKFFPLLITAAGTIPPAHVLALGAGVTGLQAIATAHRPGAVVEAYDVRPTAKEEVESLEATFLEFELEAQEGEGGYAREQSEEFLTKQRELLTAHVAAADVVITTAAVPARRAPRLLTAPMVKSMHRGSVIVDLAAETGGNCEVTQPGQVVEVDGIWVDSTTNVPSTMALHASHLYAHNVTHLLQYLISDGELKLDFEDEITRSCCVTHDGQIASERARQLMNERACCRPVHVLCADHLHQLRGGLEGAGHSAHAADVRLQRDPRRHPGRGPADRCSRADAGGDRARLRGRGPGHHQHGGRVCGHRPHVEMFKGQRPGGKAGKEGVADQAGGGGQGGVTRGRGALS